MLDEKGEFKKYRSIAIMGGTFDPIHNGHLVAAEEVLNRYHVDKIVFMPAGKPYQKASGITDCEHRYLMTVLATMRNKNFSVSRLEIDREGMTYTIDTVEELKKLCRHDVRLYFITGADAIHQILSWKEPEKLLKLCDFVAVTRPGYKKHDLYDNIGELMDRFKSKIYYMEIPALAISSTDIRDRVRTGKSIKYLVPEPVEDYIKKFGIYKNTVEDEVRFMLDIATMKEKLQSALSVKRYIHTLGVAEEAVKIAEIYGSAKLISRARVAGLLHDCAKDYPNDMKKRLCKEYHIELDEIMLRQPDLIHPFLGAEVARREYRVEDEEVLNAIRYHTTGRKKMSKLEKIIYIADFIEAGRPAFDGLEEARRLAYVDLDLAMGYILEKSIEFVGEKNKELHPLSQEALEYYKNK